MAAVAWIPGAGDLAKGGLKTGKKVLTEAGQHALKEAEQKALKEAEQKLVKEAEQKAVQEASGEGVKDIHQVTKNAQQGAAFEAQEVKKLSTTQNGVVQQISVKTESGVKTRLDAVGKDKATGDVKLSEMKSSQNAPLTKNQTVAHPEIEQSGATVVGKGKPGFEGGTKIPPTKVDIIRPSSD